jgi:hypothetical protein
VGVQDVDRGGPARYATVSATVGEENLARSTYVTVVLRVVLDGRKGLIHGDLVDLEGAPLRHFVGWRGLMQTVRGWLDSQIEGTDKREAAGV